MSPDPDSSRTVRLQCVCRAASIEIVEQLRQSRQLVRFLAIRARPSPCGLCGVASARTCRSSCLGLRPTVLDIPGSAATSLPWIRGSRRRATRPRPRGWDIPTRRDPRAQAYGARPWVKLSCWPIRRRRSPPAVWMLDGLYTLREQYLSRPAHSKAVGTPPVARCPPGSGPSCLRATGADDVTRTRDPRLGKVKLLSAGTARSRCFGVSNWRSRQHQAAVHASPKTWPRRHASAPNGR